MRIFKTKLFSKWSKKEGLTDQALSNAVDEIERGLIDADLGSNLYKKRIGLLGQGKRGSTRTLLAIKFNDKAFFLYGFTKNDRDNIDKKELEALKILANNLINYDDKKLEEVLKTMELTEVKNG